MQLKRRGSWLGPHPAAVHFDQARGASVLLRPQLGAREDARWLGYPALAADRLAHFAHLASAFVSQVVMA